MPLREEFERTGSWLFRWRSYLPLALIGVILLAMRQYRYPGDSQRLDDLWEGICLLVSCFGLGIRIFTVGYTPRATSGRNTRRQVAETLNTTGIYSIVRHPLYVGNFFMFLGVVLFAYLWWLTLIYVLVFWLYYERIMFAEEAFLRKKFGDEYMTWANNTPAFIPRFRNYRKPDSAFSLKKVLRKEYNGFFAVIIGMFILEELGEIILNGKPELDLQWVIFLSLGIIVWATLRIIKKRTTWLNECGR
jgi:protein-S-isoprenylcysteine O-methyltransferase Ste14